MELVKWLKGLQEKQNVSLALGNESGDLDSVASALCYAYLLRDLVSIVPVMNFSQSSLAWRKELLFLFEKIGLNPVLLKFKEDLPAHPQSIYLIDHHELSPDQETFRPFVVGIIDHHPGKVSSYPSLKTCHIAPCGSTATLVMEEGKDQKWPKDCALLLLAAILVDTHALKDPVKTTGRDRLAAATLLPLAGIEDMERFYQELQALKIALSPEEALRKDVKLFRSGALVYAIASLPQGIMVDPLLAEKFRKELQVPVLFLFQPFQNEKRLTLYCSDVHLRDAIESALPFSSLAKGDWGGVFSVPLEHSRKTIVLEFDFSSSLIQKLVN